MGGSLREISEPFTPEGGACGHGRTHAHDHMATATDSPMDARALLTRTRQHSPAFPTGAFDVSHGLEAKVAAGRASGAETARDWLTAALEHGAGRNDAILLAASWWAEDDDARGELADPALELTAGAGRADETAAQGAAIATTLW